MVGDGVTHQQGAVAEAGRAEAEIDVLERKEVVLVQQLEVLDVDHFAELLRREPRGVGHGNEVRAAAAEGFLRHADDLGKLLVPREGDAQVAQHDPAPLRKDMPCQRPEHFTEAENQRPRQQGHDRLKRRVGQAFQPPLQGFLGFRFTSAQLPLGNACKPSMQDRCRIALLRAVPTFHINRPSEHSPHAQTGPRPAHPPPP